MTIAQAQGQIVINEIMARPSGSQGLIVFNGNSGKEYIELYNASCSSVDVSGYYIGSRQDFAGSSGGGFRIPSVPQAIIPANGHLVLGTSASSVDANSIDIKLPDYVSNYCQNNGAQNFILANADGWVALYDASGTPIDAVYWSAAVGNISQTADYGGNPCVPSGSPGGITLESAQQINTSYSSVISYVGNTSSVDMTFSRVPDGGAWVRDVTPSINDLSVGNCNGGTCNSSTASFSLNTSITQPTCGNANGQISFAPSPAGSYTYSWSQDPLLTTGTASNLSPNTYNVTISNGSCSLDTSIILGASTLFSLNASITAVTCAQNDGVISFNPQPAGSYTYIWSQNNALVTGVASNLAFGTYTISVTNGVCSVDTTIILSAPTGCCNTPLTYTTSLVPNTVCNGSSNPCNYSGPTILINEINIFPSSGDGSIFGVGPNGAGSAEGEWIELFNPDWCNPIDISGYILGSYNSVSSLSIPASDGMAFVLPAGTVVPPLGFVVVRGINAPTPPTGVIDVVVSNSNSNLCIDGGISGGRIWFQNAGGWFAFYDQNGVVQDAINWGTPSIASDFDGHPCIPSTNSLPPSVTQLQSNNQTGISYALGNASQGQTYVRIPDGGNWSTVLASENSSYGACNVPGGCIGSNNSNSTCNGTATVSMTAGQTPFTYSWDDPLAQTTAVADSLCAGTYHLTVTDNNGCSEIISVVIVDDLLTIAATGTNPTCGNNDGIISVVASPSGSYDYVWSSNANISNTTTSSTNTLNGGIYTVTVSSPTCSLDTVITLETYPIITNLFTTSTSEKCNQSNGQITIDSIVGGTPGFQFELNGSTITSMNALMNLSQGIYTIDITDTNNCVYSKQVTVSEIQGPAAIDLNVQNTNCSSAIGKIEITNTLGGTPQYVYKINSESFSAETIFSDLGQGTYIITVQDSLGCLLDTSVIIYSITQNKELYIPNVITANNDNVNDFWYVQGECIKEIDCQIVNRWGNLIHTITDVSGVWNGKTENSDTNVTDGVYFYKLKVIFYDEEVKDYQGFITVIN